jgi:hypothetical protein
MVCHVYNSAYCKVMTIVICDMQSKGLEVQQVMWTKLNDTMLKHMFLKSNFKGFTVDNAQANWNMVIIVYGLGDPFMRMVDKESTCLFHLIQSLDRCTNQLIEPKLQDQYITLCHQYKSVTSFKEVDSFYALICY